MKPSRAKLRFDLRLDPGIRATLDVEKARQVIQDEQLITLDRAASARFLDLMDADYEPKNRMAKFRASHRRGMPKLSQ